jgi:hypothetical protein
LVMFVSVIFVSEISNVGIETWRRHMILRQKS